MDNDTDLRFALQVAGAELAETPPTLRSVGCVCSPTPIPVWI
ncbi:hypothetical protein ABZT02_45945 [Streptomyces sp. NPDC005402]